MGENLKSKIGSIPEYKRGEIVAPVIRGLIENDAIIETLQGIETFENKLNRLLETKSPMERGVASLHIIEILHNEGLITKEQLQEGRNWINMEFIVGRGRGIRTRGE